MRSVGPRSTVHLAEESREVMKSLFLRFIREDEGQDLIEYAFLAVFIGLAVTLGLEAVATGVNSQMSNIGTQVSGS
jgi:Flp pilus assembly pilin Flp